MKADEAKSTKVWVRVLAGLLAVFELVLASLMTYGAIRYFDELRQDYTGMAGVLVMVLGGLGLFWLFLPICLLGRCCWPFNRRKKTGPA